MRGRQSDATADGNAQKGRTLQRSDACREKTRGAAERRLQWSVGEEVEFLRETQTLTV